MGAEADEGDIAALVLAAGQGQAAAWDALVARFSPLVWSVARAHRLGLADAADVSQTVWLRLVEKLGQINEPGSVGAWLATVTRRECLRVLRKAGREAVNEPRSLDDLVERDKGSEGRDVERRLLLHERAAALWRAVDRLPPHCGVLLRILMTEPRPSYQEISAALDIAVGSIGPTRGRCLDRLRHLPEYVGISDGVDLLLNSSEKGEIG